MIKLGGVAVRNSRDLINKNTRLCMLVWAPFKFGKTTLAASLDRMTKRFCGKPSVIIGVEAGEGGGTMSLNNQDCDTIVPETMQELEAVIAALRTDTTFGAVTLDSATEMVKRFLQPYALKFPSREHVQTRSAGVPERSDYQVMGEACRIIMNKLIALTTLEDLNCRKHLLITALDLSKETNGVVTSVGPNLPGAMSTTCGAMMQTVAEMKIKPTVVEGKRTLTRILSTAGDGVRLVGDRTHIFPAECEPDFEAVWEKYWLPAIAAREVAHV